MNSNFKCTCGESLRVQKISNSQTGYIALMSAVVISVLLIAITVSLGLNGLFGRFNILDSESKERSVGLAEACVDNAILKAILGDYSPDTFTIGSDTCTIISSVKGASQTTIKTQAQINGSYTNMQVVINNTTFAIVSWKELANF